MTVLEITTAISKLYESHAALIEAAKDAERGLSLAGRVDRRSNIHDKLKTAIAAAEELAS